MMNAVEDVSLESIVVVFQCFFFLLLMSGNDVSLSMS